MQTLGISDSTPASENALKRLFWPSIQNASDVDALGMQGYWVCAIAAVLSFVLSAMNGQVITGCFVFLVCYLGGVGVREHSRYAASAVFFLFLTDTLLAPGIPKVFITALLLSNLRATWIAARWRPESPEAAMPVRFDETWGDKFVDKLPLWLWPKVRILYYVFSVCFIALTFVGLAMIAHRRHL